MEVFLDAGDAVRRVKAGHLIYRYDLGKQSLRVSPLRRLARAVDARSRRIIQSLRPIHPPVNHEKF